MYKMGRFMSSRLVRLDARPGMTLLIMIGLSFLYVSQALAQNPVHSPRGRIVWLEAGWSADTMAVLQAGTVVNPSSCKVTNFGYATDPNDPGRGLFHTVIVNALLNNRDVQFVVSGCAYDKPKIIGVRMY